MEGAVKRPRLRPQRVSGGKVMAVVKVAAYLRRRGYGLPFPAKTVNDDAVSLTRLSTANAMATELSGVQSLEAVPSRCPRYNKHEGNI